ncbi:TonB-dependent receptor family protein [Luteimonas sp. A277]
MHSFPRLSLTVAGLMAAAPLLAAAPAVDTAGAPSDAVTLDRIVVQASRLRGVDAFDMPASASVIPMRGETSGADADVSESLRGIPGLLARNRHNLAQDTQLSIRGFGSRATFGVRGLRLYADGIPASMPDGQGQLSHFSLIGADRMEVLRGPFSALHGNSSGGVVQIWSADGEPGDPWQARATWGADSTWTAAAQLLGGTERMGYNLALSRLDTDGWRDHSAARRDVANLKLGFDIGTAGRLQLVANHVDIPEAQDPLGLTADQVREDPRQAVANAHIYNTRKSVRQSQTGAVYEHDIGANQVIRVMAYGGEREVLQYLPIPPAPQGGPLHAGGVIDLDNRYHGFDARWSLQSELAGRPLEVTVGTNVDRQRQDRRGWENFVGDQLGVRGGLRRDERNRLENADVYAQAWWRLADRWSLLLGARHSEVEFDSSDSFVTGVNPDDSGQVRHRHTAPVAGISYAPDRNLRVYASAGRGFETPTFNEISYRADGGAGLAFDLQPAVSDNYELGMKWRGDAGMRLEAALFRADTADELAVARNAGGRSSFRNVGSARRQGLELAWGMPLGEAFDLAVAATQLDATFRSDYLICQGAGCTVPSTLVPAGTRIPGVPEQQLSARLEWREGPWTAALEGEAVSSVPVNDLGTESAAGYGLLNLEASRSWRGPGGTWRAFARIDNLLDRDHIGSVIVNEGNGRFYEPGRDRSWLVGLHWTGRP